MTKFNFLFLLFISAAYFVSCDSNTETAESPKEKSDFSAASNDEPIVPNMGTGLIVSFKKYAAEECYESTPYGDEEGTFEPETFCAYRKVDMLFVALTNKLTADKINQQIFNAVTGKKQGSISLSNFVNEVKGLASIEEASTDDIAVTVVDSTQNYLSVCVSSSTYMYQAAHPGHGVRIFNFDLKTGATIKLSDLFIPGFENKLKRIVESAFIKNWGEDNWDFTKGNGSFYLSANFSIEKNGLVFSYNPYEIGVYAAGAPDVTIKWEQLKALLKENPYIK